MLGPRWEERAEDGGADAAALSLSGSQKLVEHLRQGAPTQAVLEYDKSAQRSIRGFVARS